MIISRSTLVCFLGLLSATSTTAENWYTDYSALYCKDQNVVSPPDWVTDFYTAARDCCSAKLAYLDPAYCDSRSNGLLSDWFYIKASEGRCVKDKIGTEALHTDVLHEFVTNCCNSIPWVNEHYCTSRSEGHATGYTDMWTLDYANLKCTKDCATDGAMPECIPLTGVVYGATALHANAADCCDQLYNVNDKTTCQALSTGVPGALATKYYSDYDGPSPPSIPGVGRCAKNCNVGGDLECGGELASYNGVQLFNTAQDCCSAKFGWMDPDLCESLTTGDYTDQWYSDGTKCIQDCASDPLTPCGGRPTSVSTKLDPDATACCATQLSWLPQATCVATSTHGGLPLTGSNEFYADWAAGTCKRDCASGPDCGGILPAGSTTPTHVLGTTCCSTHFNWMNQELCNAKITGSHTGRYYTSSSDRACKQDCVGPSPSCGGYPTDLTTALDLTPEVCCARLPWVPTIECVSKTNTGVVNPGTGSGLWYKSNAGEECLKDCLTGVDCVRLATPWERPVYPNIEACCTTEVWWKNDCAGPAAALGTRKWYIDWSVSKCVKDCADTTDPECGGLADTWERPVHATLGECCTKELWWKADCTVRSGGASAPGSGKWYVDWTISKCVKDCPTTSGGPGCGGLAETWENPAFTSAIACCDANLWWKKGVDCHI